MKFHGKSEVNAILKKHNYKAIESDKPNVQHALNYPYRTMDNKIVKGISLFRTSPVTFTDVGRKQGITIVDELIEDLKTLGDVKRLSEFGFVSLIPVNAKKALILKGRLDSKEGIIYDQTFYYLDISSVECSITEIFEFIEAKNYKDKLSEEHTLCNEYLDFLLKQ